MKKYIYNFVIVMLMSLTLFSFVPHDMRLLDSNENIMLSFETIAKGWMSNYPSSQKELVIVRNNTDWQELWKLHESFNVKSSNMPLIDFSKYIVVALFLGPSGGADKVKILNVKVINNQQNKYHIIAVKHTPSLDCNVIALVTKPFHIIKLEKINIEPAEFILKLKTQVVSCD